MQKTGTIANIIPTQQGGYQGAGGWVYTFMMTIDCPDGQFTGEIGSRTQPYPLGEGQSILVEMSEGQYGPKFKKINPQYAGQQGGQSQQSYNPPPQAPRQEQSYTPPPQGAPPASAINSGPPQRVPSEWDKPIDWHDKKQLLIVRQSSISNAIAALELKGAADLTLEQILSTAKTFSQFVYDGIVKDELDKALLGGQPNPDYSENPPPTQPGDDVPF